MILYMCLYSFYFKKTSVDKPLLEYMSKKLNYKIICNEHELMGARSTKWRERARL